MSGSESKSGQEGSASSPNEGDRTSLADFLAPPKSRASIPAPEAPVDAAPIDAAPADAASVDAAPVDAPTLAADDASIVTANVTVPREPASSVVAKADNPKREDPSTALTPTEPTTVSDVPPRPQVTVLAETRPSVAPASTGDAAARSLIPVATGTSSSDSEGTDEELEGDFQLPGASAPWSGAAVRRATFVALLAAAAAVPAWVVFRARTTDVQARSETPSQNNVASGAAPSTLTAGREIEADDNQDDLAPAASAAVPVALDPVKGLEMRREARRLLEAGQIDQGVAAARRSIELNPNDPECYVLLAAGLQDQGRWAESREVFSRCVHKSNNAINAECVYFATSGSLTNR